MDGQHAAQDSRVRSRRRADLLLSVAAGIEMQVELLLVDAPARDLAIARGLMVSLAVALALRRSAPLPATLLAVPVLPLLGLLDPAIDSALIVPFFAMLFMSYSLAANTSGRRWTAGTALWIAFGAWTVLIDGGGADDFLFLATIMIAGPQLLGRAVQDRARLGRALREKAAAVEGDRAARRAAAVSEERARIAGELHELVTTAIAAMVADADRAERLARTDAVGAATALAAIEERGRAALAEIRLLLGVLRREQDGATLEPLPSLAHLADLVERVRAAGLPVELRVDGEAAALPAGVDVTAYRVVQEALGDALDAGDAGRATVRLAFAERELTLEVSDAGAVPRADPRRLLGIRERVALYGGDLVTEARGHRVRARLPLERA
jgi:signal transduction histidine kinase